MTPREMYRTRPQNATPTPHRWTLVAFAAGFLLLYLAADFVVANLASSTMPLPDASADVTQRWFADNPSAAVTIGVCQLLSVACLGGFAVSLRQGAATDGQVHAARKATPWGLLAVACMALSSVAAVPAIASLVSLAWFQGAALILLGRLLCIAWIISAAVSATRHLARGTWSCPTAGTG